VPLQGYTLPLLFFHGKNGYVIVPCCYVYVYMRALFTDLALPHISLNFRKEFRVYVVLVPVSAAMFRREVVRWFVFCL
jgi:hypothetical protein